MHTVPLRTLMAPRPTSLSLWRGLYVPGIPEAKLWGGYLPRGRVTHGKLVLVEGPHKERFKRPLVIERQRNSSYYRVPTGLPGRMLDRPRERKGIVRSPQNFEKFCGLWEGCLAHCSGPFDPYTTVAKARLHGPSSTGNNSRVVCILNFH